MPLRKKKGIKMKTAKKIFIIVLTVFTALLSGCSEKEEAVGAEIVNGIAFSESVPLAYAECFSIDRYEGGYSLIKTMNGEKYLLVPKGKNIPDELPSDIITLSYSIEDVYLVAANAMGHFAQLEKGDCIKFSGKKASDWYIEYARNAIDNGEMLYAGKYREPDYEMLLENDCKLSVQSTMIEHSPEVKEKLIELGIPVFVDYSSYESHPLGRSEWIKLYGEMTGVPELAESLFNEQLAEFESIDKADTGKSIAFFYINTAGQSVTRKSGDYITKMIELAGGVNAFGTLGSDSSASSVTVEAEQFYTLAKDADIIIYNSTIDGEIASAEQLIAKSDILSDLKAVRNGNVWCTRPALYQDSGKLGTAISELNSIFSGDGETETLEFFFKLESGGQQ